WGTSFAGRWLGALGRGVAQFGVERGCEDVGGQVAHHGHELDEYESDSVNELLGRKTRRGHAELFTIKFGLFELQRRQKRKLLLGAAQHACHDCRERYFAKREMRPLPQRSECGFERVDDAWAGRAVDDARDPRVHATAVIEFLHQASSMSVRSASSTG